MTGASDPVTPNRPVDPNDPVVLDGASLQIRDIARVATDRDCTVRLSPAARDAVGAARTRALGADGPVYGRTTGVGANKAVRFAAADRDGRAVALLRSHATSAGPLRDQDRVRAMLVVRINQLAAGGSGASPAVVDGLLDLLVRNDLPPIRELGGVGTGDLPALATTALVLLGELPTVREAAAPPGRSGPARDPVPLTLADALPMLSSNAATLGDAALAAVRLGGLARAALDVAAAVFCAVDGNAQAFAAAVEDVTPFPGARTVCRTMRQRTEGTGPPRGVQDRYALRVLPQVHGPLLDALDQLAGVVTGLVNTAAENPVFAAAADNAGVIHHGGFHAAYLAQALDAVRLALVPAAALALGRVSMLCDPTATGLPAFLGDGRPGSSGVMIVEYVVASALGELRALAAPVSGYPATLSLGAEDGASFADLAARQALRAVDAYRIVLTGELVCAVRALRAVDRHPPGLAGLLAASAALPDDPADRDLTADLDLAGRIVDHLTGH